jgi:hypothetical protein
MFVKNSDNGLVFIKSSNIKVFPCGRRRSNLIDRDGSQTTVSDRYYIPFDPEARLNTEANNRKHSGLNGFKSSYLRSWEGNGTISLVLDGYLFTIESMLTPEAFGSELETYLEGATEVYANIKLANVKFFDGADGIGVAATEVLRDQVLNDSPATCLDFPINLDVDTSKSDSYYFSGLSFSRAATSGSNLEHSLRLLVKDAKSGWQIDNTARLPKIEHGNTKDSVKVGAIHATDDIKTDGELDAVSIKLGNNYAPTMDIKPTETGTWQLQFAIPKKN